MGSADALGLTETYDRAYYATQVEGSGRSAGIIVPLILDLFPGTASVVDFGCGTGVWLRQFKAAGVARVLGVDGGAPGDGMLMLAEDEFRRVNLAEPLDLGERFDLAVSLEVAEHLPDAAAGAFVASICRSADAVVFGAALPGQGGTQHINERWPSYWAALFAEQGFAPHDVLRGGVWRDQRIDWWYRQNTLAFVRTDRPDLAERLRAAAALPGATPLDIVHPDCFGYFQGRLHDSDAALHQRDRQMAERDAAMAGMRNDLKLVATRLMEAEAASWALRSEASALRGELATLREDAAALAARIGEAEAAEAAIRASTSWRLTGPLRRATRLLRGR